MEAEINELSDKDETGRAKAPSRLTFLLSLLVFTLAIAIHAGSYFFFGLQGADVLWGGLILGGLFASIALGMALEALASAGRVRTMGLIACRLCVLLFMIALAFAYFRCRVPSFCMHYGIYRRVASQVDIAALQRWTEEQTGNFDKLDLDHLKPPVEEPQKLTVGHPYHVKLGEMKGNAFCVTINKNFGGGFWDFGALIGPREMIDPQVPPEVTTYHKWRDGVYTWL